MKKLLIFLVVFLSVTFLLGKSYTAEDFHCEIRVQSNGDLQVREIFRYYFSGEPFSWVNRVIPDRQTDGIEYLSMRMYLPDESEISGETEYEFDSGDLKARWNFEPRVDQAVDFELEFLVKRVCYEKDGELHLRWQPLPRDRGFEVARGKVEVIFPREIEMPQIIPVDNTKVSVITSTDRVIYQFENFKKREVFPLEIILESGVLPIEQPQWQLIKEKRAHYGKYLLWLLGFTAILGLILVILLIRKSIKKSQLYTPGELPVDLYKLHPCYVSNLVNGISSSQIPYAAMFFRLLKTGVVKLEKVKNKKYRYELTEVVPEDELDKMFHVILQEQQEKSNTDLKKLFRSLDKYSKEFSEHIKGWFFEQGYVDKARYDHSNKWWVIILITFCITVLVFLAGIISFSSGNASLLFVLFPLVWIIYGMVIKVTDIEIFTESGNRLKHTWKLWKKVISGKMKDKTAEITAEDFDTLFPYCMVLGIGEQFINYSKKSGIDLSESRLMQSFENLDEVIVFVAWYAAMASSTGASGGGAAGGGAGGGSASAG